MKAFALIGAGLVVLIAAFVLLPKLALQISGDNNSANVPFAKAASASATAGGTPFGNDPILPFSALASQAGFTPLDPGVVPAGFVPEGSYVDANPVPTVIFAYRNTAGRYLLITERTSVQVQPGSDSLRNRPPNFGARGRGTPRPNAPQLIQLPSGTPGIYSPDDFRASACQQGDPTGKYTCGDQPASSIRFSARGLDIVVTADGRDLSQDDLLKTAGGLR